MGGIERRRQLEGEGRKRVGVLGRERESGGGDRGERISKWEGES